MTGSKHSYRFQIILLIIISTLVRAFLAASLELGNDEVYYRLYALYPDWSHFDHPLMVGLVMQIFSFNMFFQSEFALRLSAVIIGAVNIWMMYKIGSTVKNERTGFYSALLYVASIYGTIISGVFILPDTPQGLFWLISIYLMIITLPAGPGNPQSRKRILMLGLTLGLGILSKYTTVFLWLGAGFYILLFRREWLKSTSIYLAVVISILCALPILVWNLQNDFISFTFHGSRVEMTGYGINFSYFFREIIGELLYNNPVNVALIVIALWRISVWKLELKKAYQAILVLSSLPLIMSFLIFSLFRETLPHWSALGYVTLIFLGAVCLDQKKPVIAKTITTLALIFTTVIIVAGYAQVKYGIFQFPVETEYSRMGKNDPSLDMFGYRQTGEAFKEIVARDLVNGTMPEESVLFGDNWFPLANYEYYAAYPAGLNAMAISDLSHLHKYAWINQELGGFKIGMDGYYLSDSKYYRVPYSSLINYFESVVPIDTIHIYRNNKIVKRAFVWQLKNMVKVPEDPFKGD